MIGTDLLADPNASQTAAALHSVLRAVRLSTGSRPCEPPGHPHQVIYHEHARRRRESLASCEE